MNGSSILSLLTVSAAAPTDLNVNGLSRLADLASSAFPLDGSFVLSWAGSSLHTAEEKFEIQLSAALDNDLIFSTSVDAATTSLQLPHSAVQALTPGSTYSWRVGQSNAWSASCSFETAPAPSQWDAAEWVGGASQLRTDWHLPTARSIVRARAYATGVGAIELRVNGAKVGDHFMDPGQSVYDEKVLFVTFNLTSRLVPGRNAIGALLGNSKFGYLDIYANRTAAEDQSGDSTRALLMVMTCTFDDGSELTLHSNASRWLVRRGPIVYDHLWHGEIYDSRLALPTWDQPIDVPMQQWQPAARMRPKVGSLFPQLMPPIRVTETLQPAGRTADGAVNADGVGSSVIYDFGANLAGTTTLSFTPPASGLTAAARSIILKLVHAETVDAAGVPNNVFFPGMERNLPGGRSLTCSMADWYSHKWCAAAAAAIYCSGALTRVLSSRPGMNAPTRLSHTSLPKGPRIPMVVAHLASPTAQRLPTTAFALRCSPPRC